MCPVKIANEHKPRRWCLSGPLQIVLCQLLPGYLQTSLHIWLPISLQSPFLPSLTAYPFILLSFSPSICITTFNLSLLGRKRKKLTSKLNIHTHSLLLSLSPSLSFTHTHIHTEFSKNRNTKQIITFNFKLTLNDRECHTLIEILL